MSFTDEAWARTAHLRAAIDGCRFLRELGAGTLDPAVFRHYLEQDALYLAGYGRALALLAARAPDVAAAAFWASSAQGAAVVETALHADLLGSGALPPSEAAGGGAVLASPTTQGYVSYLVATAATAPYAVAVAAVLPCFWVYADVARRLAGSAAAVLDAGAEHPYARWIAAYDAEGFHASVATARRLADEAAAAAGDPAPLHEAFATATRYEFLFWETALDREGWSLPLTAPVPA
ncbi:TenA family transcriptional regulator [Kineococcus gypseus]|uniref:TenA family transcriptional regulator n=1 Tax=Kineococcus gypseus TaxID=1637102 RepID=UPI003D7D8CA6